MKQVLLIASSGFILLAGMTAHADTKADCKAAQLAYEKACAPLQTAECHAASSNALHHCAGTDLKSPACSEAQATVARVCVPPQCEPARLAAEKACSEGASASQEKGPKYGEGETLAATTVAQIGKKIYEEKHHNPTWEDVKNELKKQTAVQRKFTLKTALDQYNLIFSPPEDVKDPSLTDNE